MADQQESANDEQNSSVAEKPVQGPIALGGAIAFFLAAVGGGVFMVLVYGLEWLIRLLI